MGLKADFRKFLAGDPDVASLTDNGLRIYPFVAPRNAGYPCVVFGRVRRQERRALTGQPVHREAARLLVVGYATSPEEAETLGDALRKLFSRKSPGQIGSTFFADLQVDDEDDDWEEGDSGDDTGYYLTSFDVALVIDRSRSTQKE